MAQLQEAEDIAFNRDVVCTLLDVTKTLARQALPFRGSDEKDGNVYQIVRLVSRHVSILKRWLLKSDKRMNWYHVTYLSPQSQNEHAGIHLSSRSNNCIGNNSRKYLMFTSSE